MKSGFLLMLVALLLCGCASAGRNFDSRKITEIKKGETTSAELFKMFGPPSQRGVSSERGETYTWVYSEAAVKGATFIPVVGAFAGGVDTRNKVLTVKMNPDGKVATYEYSSGAIGSTGTASGSNSSFENATPVEPIKSPKDGGR